MEFHYYHCCASSTITCYLFRPLVNLLSEAKSLYSSFSEPVSEPVPYLTLTKLYSQNSQKLLDRNLECIDIFYAVQTEIYLFKTAYK